MSTPLLHRRFIASSAVLIASIFLAIGCAIADEHPPPAVAPVAADTSSVQVVAGTPFPAPSEVHTPSPAATPTPKPTLPPTPIPAATATPLPTVTPAPEPTLTPAQIVAGTVESVKWIQSNNTALVFLDSRCPQLPTKLRAEASVLFQDMRPLTQMAYDHHKGKEDVYTESWQRRIARMETRLQDILAELDRKDCPR